MNQDHADYNQSHHHGFDSAKDEQSYIDWLEEIAADQLIDDRECEKFHDTGDDKF